MLRRFQLAATLVVLASSVAAYAGTDKLVRRPNAIKDRYIVVLQPTTDLSGVIGGLLGAFGGKNRFTYNSAFKGFLLEAPDPVAMALSRDPRVDFVEEDHRLELATSSWALDRIDDRLSPRMDGSYAYCHSGPGARTFVYVFDTGIWFGHDEFTNLNYYYQRPRVQQGFDFQEWTGRPNESDNPCTEARLDPVNTYNAAHGTAVASIIGGRTMGVAPDAILRPVLVATCYGNTTDVSAVAAGADWVVHIDDKDTLTTSDDEVTTLDSVYLEESQSRNGEDLPRVANMSFTVDYSTAHIAGDGYWLDKRSTLENAVNHLVNHGVTVVVAAGNSDRPVAGYDPRHGTYHTFSPARIDNVITVGGTKGMQWTDVDSRWDDGPQSAPGSNFGAQIDISAPASNIRAAHWSSSLGVRDQGTSGTSFSTALVSGAAARRLSEYTYESPQQVRDYLVNAATTGINISTLFFNGATYLSGTPDRLLWVPWIDFSGSCHPRIVGH